MKKYIPIFLAVALALLFVSCEKESAGVTKITYYPVFSIKGDNPLVVTIGNSFVDPGFSATMAGKDITDKVEVSSNVDTNTMGVYTVSYSATNEDGYSYAASRKVIVANPGHVDNVYSADSKMGSRHYEGCITVITLDPQGYYVIDDLCGGFYYYGRYPGYEPTYNFHAKTAFILNQDYTIKVIGKWNWYFVNSFDYGNVVGGLNPSTGVISYNFDGLQVVLTPVA